MGVGDGCDEVGEGTAVAGAVSRRIVGVGSEVTNGSLDKKAFAREIATKMATIVTTTPSPNHNQGMGSRLFSRCRRLRGLFNSSWGCRGSGGF
jgi:hypothetical protein